VGKQKGNARVKSPFLCVCKMYVHWREREHEEIDFLDSEDPATIVVLSQCGLLKFFQCPFMRAEPGTTQVVKCIDRFLAS
jgi:hypothetical protein